MSTSKLEEHNLKYISTVHDASLPYCSCGKWFDNVILFNESVPEAHERTRQMWENHVKTVVDHYLEYFTILESDRQIGHCICGWYSPVVQPRDITRKDYFTIHHVKRAWEQHVQEETENAVSTV